MDFSLHKDQDISHNAIGMTLIGQDILQRAGRTNAPLRKWLEKWATTAQSAPAWGNLNDVRKKYLSADGVKLKSRQVVTVFNVKGGNYRLLTSVDYDIGSIEVLEVLTHAEYDREQWKDRY